MRKISGKDLSTTLAHDNVPRKALIQIGDLESKIQTVNEAWLEPNKELSSHVHHDCEEIYYFLTGEGQMTINNEILKVGAGDLVVVEVDEEHSLKNTGADNLRFLTVRALVD